MKSLTYITNDMRDIYINKMLGKNKAIRALTLSDFSLNASSAFTGLIFTLFVINQIDGATITDSGLSTLLFLGVSAILNIPLGRLLDSTKGYVDEGIVLSLSSLIRGISLCLLAFSTQLWQLYVLQMVLGVARSMDFTSWRVLFSKFLDPSHVAEQWSMYDTVIALGYGVATLIGGYLGDTIPFSYIILIGGIISIVGAVFPLFIINDLKHTKE